MRLKVQRHQPAHEGVLVTAVAAELDPTEDAVARMQPCDQLPCFVPSLLLSMVFMYTLGKYLTSIVCIFFALSLVEWAPIARVVRSQALSIRETEYVEAARSIGVGGGSIMLRHILPNCIPSLIVLYTLNVPSCILSESTLSFLGIGVQPPAASWGLMVNQSKQFLFSMPWLALAPCIAIMVVVLAFNFLGDGLRDVLDPYLQTR